MPAPYANPIEHLGEELEWLRLKVQREVLRLRAAGQFHEDQFRGLYVSDGQVDALLQPRHAPLGVSLPGRAEAIVPIEESIAQLRQQIDARADATVAQAIALPLRQLATLFCLSPLECEALIIAAAPEIDLGFASLYAYVQNDVTRKLPTLDLAFKLLRQSGEPEFALRACFAPDAPLLRHSLIRLGSDAHDPDPPLNARTLRTDERVVNYLLGLDLLDPQLTPFTTVVKRPAPLASLALSEPVHARLQRLVSLIAQHHVLVFLSGPDGVGKRAAAETVCGEAGLPAVVADFVQSEVVGETLLKHLALLRREAILRHAGLVLNRCEAFLNEAPQVQQFEATLARVFSEFPLPLFVVSEQPWQSRVTAPGKIILSLEFARPEFPLRHEFWRRALGRNENRLGPDVDLKALASRFSLTGEEIGRAADHAVSLAALRDSQAIVSMQDLHAGARAQSNQNLRALAQKVEPKYGWNDIVLPPRAMRQLRDVYTAARHRHVVCSDWGFDRKLAMGKGLNALFCGPSGTGKTMAASILAAELGLELYKIDLSRVVSKYIGETEKQLSSIFREAQGANCILLFDEADALFGKRSEVKDAHDRYANIEVAYLLQKMEEYEGIAILATNLRNNMDEAFARRMHNLVEFPFPEAEYRERIWRAIIPREAPQDAGIDFGFLARHFEVSGGNIRNIALAAAFAAVDSESPIRMEHLVISTSRELQKIGKLPSRADFGVYYDLIRERA